MTICFDCWQLIQVNDVKPKKVHSTAKYNTVEPKGYTPREKKFLNMPNSDYRYSVQLGVFVREGYHSKYVPQDQLYCAKSWAIHKKRQLSDRLAVTKNKIYVQCNFT